MTKKQIGLIGGIIAVVFIAYIIASNSTHIKTDVKVDSTEVKVDSVKTDSTKK